MSGDPPVRVETDRPRRGPCVSPVLCFRVATGTWSPHLVAHLPPQDLGFRRDRMATLPPLEFWNKTSVPSDVGTRVISTFDGSPGSLTLQTIGYMS